MVPSRSLLTDASGRLATREMSREEFMALPIVGTALPNEVGSQWRQNLGDDADPDWWAARVTNTCPVTRVMSIDWRRVRLIG